MKDILHIFEELSVFSKIYSHTIYFPLVRKKFISGLMKLYMISFGTVALNITGFLSQAFFEIIPFLPLRKIYPKRKEKTKTNTFIQVNNRNGNVLST